VSDSDSSCWMAVLMRWQWSCQLCGVGDGGAVCFAHFAIFLMYWSGMLSLRFGGGERGGVVVYVGCLVCGSCDLFLS